MLLTISTTHQPATDLGYLLHKHPEKTQAFPLSFGRAHVFYPEASTERTTAALLLEVDPVGLVRRKRNAYASIANYVNDRPYAASSFTSVAIAKVFGSALAGRCADRETLAETEIPLHARLAAVPCHGGPELLERLFAPLGYEIGCTSHPLDPEFEEWGESRYYTLDLRGSVRLRDLLRHLYVLIPVLDNAKHYFVSHDEVEKLLAKGKGWLTGHPELELITSRYLARKRSLTRAALAQLVDEQADPDAEAEARDAEEQAVEERIGLHEQRLGAVAASLRGAGCRRVVDLGCGEGRLIRLLLKDRQFTEVLGMDVSVTSLKRAVRRLRLDRMPPAQRERVELVQGSLMYRDERISGYDGAAVIEVIEHLDPPRLRAFERTVFEYARPRVVALTTPNREYNALFESLPAGELRHRDHRFEWTRTEFETWATGVAERFGYSVRFISVGPEDMDLGAPTQMAVFEVAAAIEGVA